jgi:hypothetical protein
MLARMKHSIRAEAVLRFAAANARAHGAALG